MKRTNKILCILIASGVLLLSAGSYLLFKDDVAETVVNQNLSEYAPEDTVFQRLEEKARRAGIMVTSDETSEPDEASETFDKASGAVSADKGSKSKADKKNQTKQEDSVGCISEDSEGGYSEDDYYTEEYYYEEYVSYMDVNNAAWITIPDTKIDFPVMYSGDNEYYLRRSYTGKYLYAGSIFLDGSCSPDFSGNCNVVYGHSMNNGSMFGSLKYFKNKKYFNNHNYGWLLTDNSSYYVDFFAVSIIPSTSAAYNTETSMKERMKLLKNGAAVWNDREISEDDKLLLLSTCSYEYNNARTVLVGQLIAVE